MWVPVHDEEWDGDVPLGLKREPSQSKDVERGTVTFKGNALPWLVGRYEVSPHRLHANTVYPLPFPSRSDTTMMENTTSWGLTVRWRFSVTFLSVIYKSFCSPIMMQWTNPLLWILRPSGPASCTSFPSALILTRRLFRCHALLPGRLHRTKTATLTTSASGPNARRGVYA